MVKNKKQVIRLRESDLHRIIKESVKNVLNEGDKSGGLFSEINKSINYFYSEAMQNLESLLKAYEEIPDEYSAMKNSNMSMVRVAIKDLKLAYSGQKWQEEGPSLSMMANYPNIGKIKESANNVINESSDFVINDDVWLYDEDVFGDLKERLYVCKCYDGYAIGEFGGMPNNVQSPKKIHIKYPKMSLIKRSPRKVEHICDFMGYTANGMPPQLSYDDILMVYGEIDGIIEP